MTALVAANQSVPNAALPPAPYYDAIEEALKQSSANAFAREREQREIAEIALAREQAKVAALQQKLAATEAARLEQSNIRQQFSAAISGYSAQLRLWRQACAEYGSGAEVYLTTPTTQRSDVTDEPLNLLQIAYVEAFDRCCALMNLPLPYSKLRLF
jgi:hypothetical protein